MNNDANDKLSGAIDAIKADTPSQAEITNAAERVRAAIELERGPKAVSAESWNSIDDYISAIPAYLNKTLTAQQALLFEEELRTSIPLRRAVDEVRGRQKTHVASPKRQSHFTTMRWLATAASVALVAVAMIMSLPELPSFNQGKLAQVSEVDGQLYHIVDGDLQELQPGNWIDGRQRIRSAVGSSAIITLDDGSEIEADERSELSMTRRGSGNRIDVSRGRILVAASPQGSGRLDVFTDEFMVSVTGTIFEVAHGAKGSRVAVIEGSVDVSLEGHVSSLEPGEALGSRSKFETLNLEDEISWSQDADDYIAMLREVSALQKDIQAAMDSPARFSTKLLNLVPEKTAVYMAVPNAPEKIAEVYDVIRTRMQTSTTLNSKWTEFEAASETEHLQTIMTWMQEIGDMLGEETVLALALKDKANSDPNDSQGEHDRLIPVVLSEVDTEAFRATFDKQITQLAKSINAEGKEFEVVIVDDAAADAVNGKLSVLLVDDLLVASSDVETLQAMHSNIASGSSAFVGTEMYEMLEAAYKDGTEVLGALDVAEFATIFADSGEVTGASQQAFADSGLSNVEYVIAQYEQENGVTVIAGDLYFAVERQGLMALLAEPGPMGSLEFFSTDTTFATALLTREPISVLENMSEVRVDGEPLSNEPGAQIEIQLLFDIVSSVGGEFAFGLDGPALPTPAWKAVVEAYDEESLQAAITEAVQRFNDNAALAGNNSSIELRPADVGGYTGYSVDFSIDATDQQPLSVTSVPFNYVYVEGYLVAAANAALIDRAIGFYKSGSGLPTDSEFQALMARDGYLDYSALFYSRLGEVIGDVMGSLPAALSEEQQLALTSVDSTDAEIGPSMTSVLALPDKIHLAHSGSSQLPMQVVSQLTVLMPLIENASDSAKQ